MVQPVSTNLIRTNIRDIGKLLIKRETSVEKLCNDSLRIAEETKNLGAFITTCKEDALKKAKSIDKTISSNGFGSERWNVNHLLGVPISVKDNFCTNQILTTCGSKMLHNFIPSYTATAVSKLLKSGCIMVGKTNMDEFAMGSSSTTSFFGPTANYLTHNTFNGTVLNKDNSSGWYMAGGSSTGSAVSVASGTCFASLGTDTGGSTRQPASLTGIVGFKPTYGLISRFGLVPLAHCLDVVSILARSVDDVQVVFDAIVGQDENDLTTVDHQKVLKQLSFQDSPSEGRTKIRVGVPEEFIIKGDMSEDISNQFNTILRHLSNLNINGKLRVEVIKLSLPHSNLATECYTIISSAEIASNMSCYDGVKYGFSTNIDENLKHFDRDEFFKANRNQGFGSEVKKRILLGNYFLLAGNREKYINQAQKVRRMISEEFNEAFSKNNVDIIIMPSTPTTSVSYEEWLQKHDDNKLFHEDYYLIPANLANLPSINLPAGFSSKGLPIGMQLISNKFHDLDLLSIAKMFEREVFKEI